jgi:hypothetical protein
MTHHTFRSKVLSGRSQEILSVKAEEKEEE